MPAISPGTAFHRTGRAALTPGRTGRPQAQAERRQGRHRPAHVRRHRTGWQAAAHRRRDRPDRRRAPHHRVRLPQQGGL